MSGTAFREKIREALADQALQAALDGNAARRGQGRLQAFASLPDWQERRRRAHAVRARVIADLPDYLQAFCEQAAANGLLVHHAQDAARAIRICLDIVAASAQGDRQGNTASPSAPRPSLIAKSKSMVSEEISLNHALEAAGHRVVETDLGEYIVQLRGERPSHIITPAVHLRRHEVGALFQEKLGVPYSEDIATLTNTARAVLRQVFLDADVGVSGVNFGVAETGTLAIVTNEGNGRMVTTLPRTHIALMGMERLLPSLDDLALMLSLLPRSATGQKLSVYTQLIQRPEPGQQRHLIVLDNGRSRLRASSLREALYCIRCGACLNACPVFRELGGHAYLGNDGTIAPYPGPIGAVVSPGLLGRNFTQLAQASSLCGACKDACPVDIDLPMLLTRVRAGGSPSPARSAGRTERGAGLSGIVRLGLQVYTHLATRPRLFALAQRLAGIGSRLLSPRTAWMRLPAFTGWGYSKDFPRPAARPFRDRWSGLEPGPGTATGAAKRAPADRPANGQAPAPPTAADAQALARRFTSELQELGGQVITVAGGDPSEAIVSLLRARGIERVQAWDRIPGVDPARLEQAGIRLTREMDATLEAGITGALAGIAETGTLVLPGGPGRPLSASLLPEVHIAVLRCQDLLPTLEAALQLPEVARSESTVLVTGPSRTADIEMTLTIGVHGPGELHVLLLE